MQVSQALDAGMWPCGHVDSSHLLHLPDAAMKAAIVPMQR